MTPREKLAVIVVMAILSWLVVIGMFYIVDAYYTVMDKLGQLR